MVWHERAKKLAIRQGVTQQQIAEAVGKSLATVGRWLNGQGAPDPEALNTIAELLHVRSDDLIREDLPLPETRIVGPRDADRADTGRAVRGGAEDGGLP